jgi:hypothetical protein
LAGITAESDRFERSAADVTRLAGAPSAAETAETVSISAEAREPQQTNDSVLTGDLEQATVDTRVAKYAYIANLKLLKAADDMAQQVGDLLDPKR